MTHFLADCPDDSLCLKNRQISKCGHPHSPLIGTLKRDARCVLADSKYYLDMTQGARQVKKVLIHLFSREHELQGFPPPNDHLPL